MTAAITALILTGLAAGFFAALFFVTLGALDITKSENVELRAARDRFRKECGDKNRVILAMAGVKVPQVAFLDEYRKGGRS